jgi:hypothetical protein
MHPINFTRLSGNHLPAQIDVTAQPPAAPAVTWTAAINLSHHLYTPRFDFVTASSFIRVAQPAIHEFD